MAQYQADYSQCTECSFVFANSPNWLHKAYNNPMTSTDLGTVSRASQNSLRTKAIIDLFFHSATRFLDYGAGYGVFVRRMRDLGYNFFAYDTYCENLFAKNFEVTDLPSEKFDLVTAFEVFEHLEEPGEIFEKLLKNDTLLFSTELLPEPNPELNKWWYYGLEHGQHISFYSRKTLEAVARKYQRHLYSWGNLHLLSRKPISEYWYRKAIGDRMSEIIGLWKRRPTLLSDDWQNLRREVLAKMGYSQID